MIYDSLDTIPLLNYHMLLKTGDFKYLHSTEKKLKGKKYEAIYEKLIDSAGKKELLNGHYAKLFRLFLAWDFEKNGKTENAYSHFFHSFLETAQKYVKSITFEGSTFQSLKEAYIHIFKKFGHDYCLKNRVYLFNIYSFEYKKYDTNIYNDIANVEAILNLPINPKEVTVNHYKELVKAANNKIKNATK